MKPSPQAPPVRSHSFTEDTSCRPIGNNLRSCSTSRPMLRYCLRDIVGDVHRSTSSVCLRYLLREFEVRAWSRIGYGDTCVNGFNDDLLLARQSYLNLQGEKWEFLARGYTVDAPLRRGRSESTGTFVEECSEYANPCTAAEQATITDRSIKEALLHADAVLASLSWDESSLATLRYWRSAIPEADSCRCSSPASDRRRQSAGTGARVARCRRQGRFRLCHDSLPGERARAALESRALVAPCRHFSEIHQSISRA